jgi:hypothetical protein
MATTETTITPHESTKLTVVYTIETWKVNETLAMFERWLNEDKKGTSGLWSWTSSTPLPFMTKQSPSCNSP